MEDLPNNVDFADFLVLRYVSMEPIGLAWGQEVVGRRHSSSNGRDRKDEIHSVGAGVRLVHSLPTITHLFLLTVF